MEDSSVSYRIVSSTRFIDLNRLWSTVAEVKLQNRSRTLMAAAGVRFFDTTRQQLIAVPSVGIVGIGGIPIKWENNTPDGCVELAFVSNAPIVPDKISRAVTDMMGFGGFVTYLNPSNRTPQEMFDTLVKHQHFSTAHQVSINIGVFGVSTAVENEFNSQRDLIHLARLTEARTLAQTDPPIVVLYPELAALTKRIIDLINGEIQMDISISHPINREFLLQLKINLEEKDDEVRYRNLVEAFNLLYPAAKGTLFILTGTLKNLQKMMAAIDDLGKEEEYRRALALINDNLFNLWPALFKPSSDYGFQYPLHFSESF